MKVIDWIKKWSEFSPNQVAFKELESGRTYTYEALNKSASKIANFLSLNYEIQIGDRIAIIAENCIEYILLLGVAQKMGIILAPLNYRLQPVELDGLMEQVTPSLILFDQKYEQKITATSHAKSNVRQMPIEALIDLSRSESGIFENIHIDDDHAALIIFTSGTTGQPKGSIYTHKMMHYNSLNTSLRLDITSKDRSINCAPPFHTGGWNVLLTPFIHHGAFTLIMKSFDPDIVLQSLEKEHITVWWAVPTMLKMMQDAPSFKTVNLENVRYFIVGGEAMPLPLIRLWEDRGIPIRQGYGLTEVGPNVTSLNEEDSIRKIGSIGKPNFYYEIKVIDEDGNKAEVNAPGELWLSGPTVSPGYININPKDDKDRVNGWFRTGDIVTVDDEGFLFVVDRIKNMYISGGENVYPTEVEGIIRQIDGIDDVAIIGVPHEKWGEIGKAFVVRKKGTKLSDEDILRFCASKMAKYKVPGTIAFVEELPKNDAGKIDKKVLKQFS